MFLHTSGHERIAELLENGRTIRQFHCPRNKAVAVIGNGFELSIDGEIIGTIIDMAESASRLSHKPQTLAEEKIRLIEACTRSGLIAQK